MRHKCSECGQLWKDCTHVSFGDIYAARRLYVVQWAVIGLVVAGMVASIIIWAAL